MDISERGHQDDGWDAICKIWNMDATLIGELDRLAADHDMSTDECLRQLMRVRAEHEGTEAVRMMVETATDLWRNFKPGAQKGRYWTMRRAQREAAATVP